MGEEDSTTNGDPLCDTAGGQDDKPRPSRGTTRKHSLNDLLRDPSRDHGADDAKPPAKAAKRSALMFDEPKSLEGLSLLEHMVRTQSCDMFRCLAEFLAVKSLVSLAASSKTLHKSVQLLNWTCQQDKCFGGNYQGPGRPLFQGKRIPGNCQVCQIQQCGNCASYASRCAGCGATACISCVNNSAVSGYHADDEHCGDCGEYVCGDCTLEDCRGGHGSFCSNCLKTCDGCGESLCSGCTLEDCCGGHGSFCSNCLETCAGCGENLCSGCDRGFQCVHCKQWYADNEGVCSGACRPRKFIRGTRCMDCEEEEEEEEEEE